MKKPPAVQGTNLEFFRRLLAQANAQVGEWGGHFVFVYLPNWARYSGRGHPEAFERTRCSVWFTILGFRPLTSMRLSRRTAIRCRSLYSSGGPLQRHRSALGRGDRAEGSILN